MNVAQAWTEEYKTANPKVAVAVTGGGSGTGIAALMNGTVEHVVGHDALAVYRHKDNPIDEMTIAQLKAIYQEGGEAEKWRDLGVEEAVLGKKNEYKLGSRDLHGSQDVVDLVEETPCASGYGGLAYATDPLKRPCINRARGDGRSLRDPEEQEDGGLYRGSVRLIAAHWQHRNPVLMLASPGPKVSFLR